MTVLDLPRELNARELERMRELFLSRISEFGDFQDRPSTYWNEERAYKAEFSALCRSTLTPKLFPVEMTPAGAERILQTIRQLLKQRLESIQKPQNLIGWRYSDFLSRMQDDEAVRFARGFGDLLFGSGDSPERVEQFTGVVWPIWQRIENRNPYALSRMFPTTFLAMIDPERDIPVRTDLFSRATRMLLGRSILRFEPFGASDYRAVLEFTRTVWIQLHDWAWRPRDLLDVHSFLWVATRNEADFGEDGSSSQEDEGADDDRAEAL